MIHKDKIDCDLTPLTSWIKSKMEYHPEGRINKTTGKRKEYGAQHTITSDVITFKVLYEKIHQIAKENFDKYAIIDVWTNVNLPNGKNGKHIHNGADIAGCFYIKVPENSGDIEFESGEKITPSVGDIYWWKADLEHWVHENKSNEVRYSVAFNIKNIPR